MTFHPQQLLPHLPALPATNRPPRWWIALSGGLDSCVLLHALVQLRLPVDLRALHVNHQISPFANQWQAHCEHLAASLGVAFYGEPVQVVNTGKGIEDAARQARYGVFERHVGLQDVLLSAHHGDDQAETLLLRLLRGTGPRGLAAMAQQRPLGQGVLWRPLLPFTRAQLEEYARAQGLQWVEDDSNSDTHYNRNFLRHQVMPLLQARWPGFTRRWQHTAELCAGNEQLLEEIAAEDMQRMAPRQERLGCSIALDTWLALSESRRLNVLRYWLRDQGLAVPEQVHWQQLQAQLAQAGEAAHIHIQWGQVSLRVYRRRLYAMDNHRRLPPLQLQPSTQGDGRLRADLPALDVRLRLGGERCQPSGRAHSQTLKKLLQAVELEPWLRESLPLVFSGEQLVAVGDLWVCAGYEAAQGQAGYRLYWG